MECTYTHIKSCPKQQQQQGSTGLRFLFCVDLLFSPVVDMSLHGDHDRGAAWRRRQRRLRTHWRHEQLTLQMLLATYEHHAAPRGQMTARSGGWERVVLHGKVPEHPTPQVAGTQYFAMDVDEVPVAGSRPDRLSGVRPQERDQRHTVEQIVDTVLFVPSLDVPVPQMENQLVDVCRLFRYPHSRAGYRSAQDFAYPPSSSQAPCALR